jgi:hypothetical protein
MTEVRYNGSNPFSDISPTPLVERNSNFVRYNHRWVPSERITLNGTLTGQCSSFSEIIDKQNLLIEGFRENFKQLSVWEDNQEIYKWDTAKIVDISFDESSYGHLVPFTIDIEAYSNNQNDYSFYGTFGVVDPVNKFSFENTEDQLVVLNHTTSARGFHTQNSNLALNNAISFVQGLTGWNDQISPRFIEEVSGLSPVLFSLNESINRFEGSYAVSTRWTFDPVLVGQGILRYTTEISSGIEDGITVVSLNGSIEGGRNVSHQNLVSRFQALNLYDICQDIFEGYATGSLNTTLIGGSVNDDTFTNKIDFSATFDNNPFPSPWLEDDVDIRAELLEGRNQICVKGTIKGRGPMLYKWPQILAFYEGLDIYAIALDRWGRYGMTQGLNPTPVSQSISKDEFQGQISFTFCYEESPINIPEGLEAFEYSLVFQPAIPKFSANPTLCEGVWSIYNLNGLLRAVYSIQGSATVGECYTPEEGEVVVRSEINRISSEYFTGTRKVLKQGSISKLDPPNEKIISFSYTWTAETTAILEIPMSS